MHLNDLMTVGDLRQEILNKAAEENVEEELSSVKPNLKPGHWVLVLLRAKKNVRPFCRSNPKYQ